MPILSTEKCETAISLSVKRNQNTPLVPSPPPPQLTNQRLNSGKTESVGINNVEENSLINCKTSLVGVPQ